MPRFNIVPEQPLRQSPSLSDKEVATSAHYFVDVSIVSQIDIMLICF